MTELIDGALVFMMSPQRAWLGRLVTTLVLAEHGYPPITAGGDLAEPQQALFGFRYASTVHDPDPRGLSYSRGPTTRRWPSFLPAWRDIRTAGAGSSLAW
jgi:hypothetical protein